MKRFKKVLALVLAGVLALAMLTACDGGTTDPDKIMPDDGTVEVVMTINNTAANKGLGQVEYSAKYSAVTKALLENWLEWRNDFPRQNDTINMLSSCCPCRSAPA